MAVAYGLLPFAASSSKAQQVISYQGLATKNLTPLQGAHNVMLAIYGDSTGGAAIYQESQYNITFTDGLFNVLIGSGKTNPLPIFDAGSYSGAPRSAPDYFLGISIDGGAELTPRSKLGATPTAWSSRFADSARAAGTAAIALSIVDNAVTTAKIADEAVTSTKISDGGATPGYVLTANGGTPNWRAASGLPSGAIVTFGDSGTHPGYSFTGFTGSIPVGGNTWSTGAVLPVGQESMTSAVVNGKIYVIGGPYGNNNQIYDPVTNAWSTGTALPVAQFGMTSAVVNGKIYVIGGNEGSSNNNQIYDPVANSWSIGAPLPVAEYDMTSAVLNGQIYVIGGGDNGNQVQVYHPVSNTWSTGVALPVAQQGMTSAVVNGNIYVIGGSNGSHNNNQIYDPVDFTWLTGAALPVGQEDMTSAIVNGKIYVIGGGKGSQSNNQIYDPVANTWSTGAVLPVGQYVMTSEAVNGNIYVIGGINGLHNNQIYAPGLTLYYFTKN